MTRSADDADDAGGAGGAGGARTAGPVAQAAEVREVEVPQAAEAPEVVAFWRELGLPGLIDVHTHFMPDNVLAKVWAFFEDGRSGAPWPIAYRLPEADRLALLRAFGVRRFTALSYPHKPDMAVWLNAWAAKFAERTPDALHSATFFPEPAAPDYVAAALDAGAQVFKAHIQVGAYDPRDELLTPVWGLLAEARVPVVVHCGSGPHPGRFTGPGPFAEVLARHPGLTAIIAHLGAPEYGEFLELATRYPRVHLDTTMTFTKFFSSGSASQSSAMEFPPELVPRLADLGDRILLGSDFPNIPYAYIRQLSALADLGLGTPWLRAVCHDNAVRLLGL